MENRIDTLAKALAGRGVTRRAALRRLGVGGLAAGLGGVAVTSGRRAAAQEATPAAGEMQFCLTEFEMVVREGPNAGLELTGALALEVDEAGSISEGIFLLPDDTRWRVTGQANGQAINLLFQAPDGQNVFGVGVLERDIRECSGAMGGPFVGPEAGDLGDWLTCNCDNGTCSANYCNGGRDDYLCMGECGRRNGLGECIGEFCP